MSHEFGSLFYASQYILSVSSQYVLCVSTNPLVGALSFADKTKIRFHASHASQPASHRLTFASHRLKIYRYRLNLLHWSEWDFQPESRKKRVCLNICSSGDLFDFLSLSMMDIQAADV